MRYNAPPSSFLPSLAFSLNQTDLLDKGGLEHVFLTYGRFRACIHFAGLKAVGESVAKPLLYYENNLTGTLNLLDAMQRHGCKIIGREGGRETDRQTREAGFVLPHPSLPPSLPSSLPLSLVFSSSATVYGSAESPVVEEQTVGQGITNPYGQTKYFIEKFLEDFQRSPEGEEGRGGGREGGREGGMYVCMYVFVVTMARRPVSSSFHPPSLPPSLPPSGTPNNLMPYVSQVAVGRRPQLTVFGGASYPSLPPPPPPPPFFTPPPPF